MANLVQNPYEIITDANGDPLEDGYVFIGEPGLSPITNPLQAYWDSDLTIPANSIRTKGGYFSNSGTPGRLYTATNYSILVQDKRQQTVYTQLDSVDYINSASGNNISSVDTISDLRGLVPVEPYLQVSVAGSASVGDGLMGPLYYWDPASSATDNGVSIIQPTAVTGNGRWLWINNNAPYESVGISASGTLDLAFKNRIFLVTTALAITLAVPDGDFQGQNIQMANIGSSTLQITGTGIPASTFISNEALLTWVGSIWSVTYKGTVVLADTISEFTPGEGSSIQAVSGEQVLRTIVDIGDWDMDLTAGLSVTHGIADITKIRDVNVIIRNDDDTGIYSLSDIGDPRAGYFNQIGTTAISLSRVAGGFFDSVNFDSTSYNRGWITFTHIV